MDVPADRPRSTSAVPVHPSLRTAVRSPRQRRPTGAPPPLPYRPQTSGIGWLVAAVVLIGLTLAVFAGLRGSWWTLFTVWLVLPLALIALRRWRHLIVWLVAWQAGELVDSLVMVAARRPRPFGVELRTGWGGWAIPSVQATIMTAVLMGVLYTPISYRRGRAAHLDVGGARGVAIRQALHDQLGLVVEEVKPFGLGHRIPRGRRRAGGGRGRRRRDRRRPGDHPQAVGRRAGAPRHQAGQPAGAGRSHAAASRRRAGLPAGPAAVQRGGDQRGVRRRPRPGPPFPAPAPAPRPGPRPARRVHPAAAGAAAADPDPNGEFAAQAPQVLGFTTRDALHAALGQRSGGRLQLDPERAG